MVVVDQGKGRGKGKGWTGSVYERGDDTEVVYGIYKKDKEV